MPPDRGRASKACSICRKQKTRCYAGTGSVSSCLRCQTLGLHCSLAEHQVRSEDHGQDNDTNSGTTARLQRLEDKVNRLFERLDKVLPNDQPTESASPTPMLSRASSRNRNELPTAPMQVIQDLAAEVSNDEELPIVFEKNYSSRDSRFTEDIISQGILSYQDAMTLIGIFQEHYGRWVGFGNDSPAEALLDSIRKSDLLLCACCLIAVRHTTQELAEQLAPNLFNIAKARLSAALLNAPQPLEFFQAALIMCMWSTTIGQTPLSIDSWLLSGFALQHCLTSGVFDYILGTGHQSGFKGSVHKLLVRWTVWNHLCLVHLHYCVGSRRRAMIGPVRIERCRKILEFDNVTNFQARMVAEINLYWCMYESCTIVNVDLPKVQEVLNTWKQEWKFLLDQPRSQFLEMGFNFAKLLAYERSLKSKSERVKSALLTEMVRLSVAIIQLAMDTADDRTRHLSDHIYHMITFAAVTLCRLLNLYESQLCTTEDIGELDALILNLVSWLRSIGPACHAGNTLGAVVASFHKKLRPNAQLPSPSDWPTPWRNIELTAFFPELLGVETETEVGSNIDWNFIPDWEPFYPGLPT